MSTRMMWIAVLAIAVFFIAGNRFVARLDEQACPPPPDGPLDHCTCVITLASENNFGVTKPSCSLRTSTWIPWKQYSVSPINNCDLIDLSGKDPNRLFICDAHSAVIIQCDAFNRVVSNPHGAWIKVNCIYPIGDVDSQDVTPGDIAASRSPPSGDDVDDYFRLPHFLARLLTPKQSSNASQSVLQNSYALVSSSDADLAIEGGALYVTSGSAVMQSFCAGESIGLASPAIIQIPLTPTMDLTDPSSYLQTCGATDLTGVWHGMYTRSQNGANPDAVPFTLSITGANQGTLDIPEGTLSVTQIAGNPSDFTIQTSLSDANGVRQVTMQGSATKGGMNSGVTETDTPAGQGTGSYSNGQGFAERTYIQESGLPAAGVNTPYQHQIPAYSPTGDITGFQLTQGPLPPGIVLDGAGVLSGTPSASGNFALAITASDSAGESFQQSFTLRVKDFARLNALLPDAIAGQPYRAALNVGGGTPPYSWSVLNGSPGWTVDAATGVITGTPDSNSSGVMLLVETMDSKRQSFVDIVNILVHPLVIMSRKSLPDATLGSPYSYTFKALGGAGPVTWQMDDISPPLAQIGLAFDQNTGELSGTPTAGGSVALTMTASQGSLTQSRTFTFVVRSGVAVSGGGGRPSRRRSCSTCSRSGS